MSCQFNFIPRHKGVGMRLTTYIYLIHADKLTSPSNVFSIVPLTIQAYSGSLSLSKWVVIMGILIVYAALIISFVHGTPNLIFVLWLRK